MKLKIVGPAIVLLLLIGGIGVNAESNSNNGIPDQLTKLQTTISNFVNNVTSELTTANKKISEQQAEIDVLKKEIADLKSSSSPNTKETITPEQKEAIIKEIWARIPSFKYRVPVPGDPDHPGPEQQFNITKVDVVERNGKVYLQTFTEGDYDWGQKVIPVVENGSNDVQFGTGRLFATNIIVIMDYVSDLYNVDLHYEFYQNGEKVKFQPES
ncbi:hypothetical protein [Neobacillus drentensis]|uniref:hypothetical protein n=1 Tax=Neobacillus drentensis TaxID=220684 RepID=UPI0030006988